MKTMDVHNFSGEILEFVESKQASLDIKLASLKAAISILEALISVEHLIVLMGNSFKKD